VRGDEICFHHFDPKMKQQTIDRHPTISPKENKENNAMSP